MLNITLRQLDYLIAVAECGSVTAAARSLHLSQSAVSTAVTDLEHHLGVQLFVRHARGLALTRDGEIVLGKARALINDAQGLESDAAGLAGQMAGSLHVGCYETLAPLLLAGIADTFATNHPHVSLDFTEGLQDDLLDALGRGELDVAVMYGYRFRDEATRLGFTTARVASLPAYVLLPPDHSLATASAIDLGDLAGEPFILYDRNPGAQYFLSLFDDTGTQPRVRYRARSAELVRCLVARGLGYSLLNQRPRSTLTYEGMPYVTRPLAGDHEDLDVIAVTPGTKTPTIRVGALIHAASLILEATTPSHP